MAQRPARESGGAGRAPPLPGWSRQRSLPLSLELELERLGLPRPLELELLEPVRLEPLLPDWLPELPERELAPTSELSRSSRRPLLGFWEPVLPGMLTSFFSRSWLDLSCFILTSWGTLAQRASRVHSSAPARSR